MKKRKSVTLPTKSKKGSKEFYVKPSEMWDAIEEYYVLPPATGIPVVLGKMISDISEKIAFMTNFINYTYRDEMIADAKCQMIEKLYMRKFDLWVTRTIDAIDHNPVDNPGRIMVTYTKKDKQKKIDVVVNHLVSDEDILDIEGGTVRIKNNPFSYFTKIAYHCFVNRIKKEQKNDLITAAYQEHVFENMYASGNGWENVRRSKIMDADENDESYD